MERKSIMIDMDEVIVKGRFSEFLDEFLGGVDFSKLTGYNRQDLIKGREEEFSKIYAKKSLYHNDDGSFVDPIPNAPEVIKKLSEHYKIYVVTAYDWPGKVIDSAHNLKYKFEYLSHFLPFIDPNNFIFMTEKTKIKFDIGIDDRPINLSSCDTKLLFSEFRNEKITKEELDSQGMTRVDTWLEIEKILLK